MRVDLHNHTTLCNHATGTMDEYILKAIELGIDEYGFSDHAPMDFDHKYRMDISQKQFYENSVKEIQKRYRDKIKILFGYEVDFLKGNYILDEVLKTDVDYFIGSVHFIQSKNRELWGFDNPEFIGEYKNNDIDQIWKDYFDTIGTMAKSGYFDIVGHFDLIKVFKFLPKKDIRLLAKNAIDAIKKADMVVEINSAGLRKPIDEIYPSKQLLELFFEKDIPITFGSDAHSVEQVGDGYDKALEIVKDVGYNKVVSFEKRDKKICNLF